MLNTNNVLKTTTYGANQKNLADGLKLLKEINDNIGGHGKCLTVI